MKLLFSVIKQFCICQYFSLSWNDSQFSNNLIQTSMTYCTLMMFLGDCISE